MSDLYYGLPVRVTLSRAYQIARFWRCSTADACKAWVVVWRSPRSAPEPVLVPVQVLQIVEPDGALPPMPDWADSPYKPQTVDRSWIAERQATLDILRDTCRQSLWSTLRYE